MFWFKKSKIYVDTYTYNPAVYELYPIKTYNKNIPEWWRSFPSTINQTDQNKINFDIPTIKRCDGLIEYYKYGLIVNTCVDISIKNENGVLCYRTSDDMQISQHGSETFPSDLAVSSTHIKLEFPWLMEEKTGINFLLTKPFWNQTSFINTFDIAPGVLNFKYQNAINVNLFVRKQISQIDVPVGTPMAHVIPITEKEIVIKNHLIDFQEYQKKAMRFSYNTNFVGTYKHNKKIRSKSKCPFNSK
jgi:hypothetical protein